MEAHHECYRSRPNRAVTPLILRWKEKGRNIGICILTTLRRLFLRFDLL